jgi:hypothetical protein
VITSPIEEKATRKVGDESMDESFIFAFALLVVLFASVLFIPALLTKRAMSKVIKVFCRYGALNAKKAKKAEELGLNPPGFFERMGRMRDYKPHALRFLKQMKVVRTTKDGRLYMTEKNLNENLRCNRQLGT